MKNPYTAMGEINWRSFEVKLRQWRITTALRQQIPTHVILARVIEQGTRQQTY